MSDNAKIVTDWLRRHPRQYFCQHCISRETGVKPIPQVNQIVRPLGKTREYRYEKTTCAGCGKDRMCIAYVG